MRDLIAAIGTLNSKQREAVLHPGSTVVLAGPGSGKTDTLVIKVAQLLGSSVLPPRGVACITYNNDAVGEFAARLAQFGHRPERRLYLGSVHSFCLNCILRPYARVVDPSSGPRIKVAAGRQAQALMERAVERHSSENARYYGPTLQRLRKALACREDISGFADSDLQIAAAYETELDVLGLIDFDGMILRGLHLVRTQPWITRLLVARFPWLVVDEYQDLGGPLHQIVVCLAEAGARVFAVGDPDQTVYDFVGADPKYLNDLAARDDFKTVQLAFNYRSGGALIMAGQAALAPEDGPRPYLPDPARQDPGRVEFARAADTVADHAVRAIAAVKRAIADGVAPEEVAVLYRARGELLDALRDEMSKSGQAFVLERESKYPRGEIILWLQRLATWATALPGVERESFGTLGRPYLSLVQNAGRARSDRDLLGASAAVNGVIRATKSDMPLSDWLQFADTKLDLTSLLLANADEEPDAVVDFNELRSAASIGGSCCTDRVHDFATEGRIPGRVVITTMHASKGRQFDVVILPGLTEGLMPAWRWNRRSRQLEQPGDKELRESRRLFYVGFTRARHVVHLIWSHGYTNKGYQNRLGASRFAVEIGKRLGRS